MNVKNERNVGLDLLRVLAIFTVVLIQSASTDISYRNGLLHYMPPANACFAFLAGWFLFKPESLLSEKIGQLVLKRVNRLVIPYLIWEIIYVLINMGFDLLSGQFQMPDCSNCWGIVFLGSGSVQLWFVATLIYVQVVLCAMMALFTLINKNKVCRHDISVIILFNLIGVAMLSWKASGIDCDYLRRFAFLLGYGAFGIGLRFALSKVQSVSSIMGIVFLAGVCGIVVSFVWNIPEIVSVLSWCMAFGGLSVLTQLRNIVVTASNCVMGIYLCHVLFTRLIAMSIPMTSKIITNGYIIVLANAIVGFVVSLIFVYCIKRTRLAKWLF